MSNDVFVSYAREDEALVLKLARSLKEQGVPIWLDQWDIPSGANWNRNVDKALDDCAQVLVFLSPAAVESEQVESEWLAAYMQNKPIVPVICQPCRVPRLMQLRQQIDYTSSSATYESILDQVHRALSETQTSLTFQARQERNEHADGTEDEQQQSVQEPNVLSEEVRIRGSQWSLRKIGVVVLIAGFGILLFSLQNTYHVFRVNQPVIVEDMKQRERAKVAGPLEIEGANKKIEKAPHIEGLDDIRGKLDLPSIEPEKHNKLQSELESKQLDIFILNRLIDRELEIMRTEYFEDKITMATLDAEIRKSFVPESVEHLSEFEKKKKMATLDAQIREMEDYLKRLQKDNRKLKSLSERLQ